MWGCLLKQVVAKKSRVGQHISSSIQLISMCNFPFQKECPETISLRVKQQLVYKMLISADNFLRNRKGQMKHKLSLKPVSLHCGYSLKRRTVPCLLLRQQSISLKQASKLQTRP